jgi:aminoglycoside phosphotransferase (APT) family kinase protein
MTDPPSQASSVHDAKALARKLPGRAPTRVEPLWPRVRSNDCYAFRIEIGGQPMLLKVAKRPRVPMGLYFHHRLREAGIPVPELIAAGPGEGPGGANCALWEWIEGRSSADWPRGSPCPFDEAEFGELMRSIHSLRFEGPPGLLGDDLASRTYTWGPGIRPVGGTWAEVFDCRAAAERLAERGHIKREEAEVFAALPDRLSPELNAAECRLLHMDLRSNLLLDPATGRIRAVVDYTESFAGDPRFELALVGYWFMDRVVHFLPFDMPRFRAAYGATHNPRDARGRFYLAVLLACDEVPGCDPTSTKGQWSIATFRSVLASFAGEGGTGDVPSEGAWE